MLTTAKLVEKTIRVTKYSPFSKNRVSEYTGTLTYMVEDVFGYTLECGGYKTKPRSWDTLIKRLEKADEKIHGASYTRYFYELVD